MSKKKIINDPVYGFITIYDELIFDLIQHPYFQRLRRIKQLGMTEFVYPGALHTRFHHALGVMHLMHIALENLRGKGHDISEDERQAALIAVLMHDIGHGPFSHALENTLLNNTPHEAISELLIEDLNRQFSGKLDLALKIFRDDYHRSFLHQLVASQLDVDRLDYLQRDCYFTGVSEGTIGANRIIKMFDLVDDKLVVEEKGIYSVENFLNARRLMYWQVYLHKTCISAEQMLIQILRRAKHLANSGENMATSESLRLFLNEEIDILRFKKQSDVLNAFAKIDDYDVWGAIKVWQSHPDKILSELCTRLLNRNLFKVKLSNESFSGDEIGKIKDKVLDQYDLSKDDLSYFVLFGNLSNAAYISKGKNINILTKKGEIIDVAKATDLPNITAISKIVKKYYLCWPKSVSL